MKNWVGEMTTNDASEYVSAATIIAQFSPFSYTREVGGGWASYRFCLNIWRMRYGRS